MSKGDRTSHAVLAAARDDARFKAVEVRKHDKVTEVLWTKSLPADTKSWGDFATECGFAASPDGHDRAHRRHAASVVGLDPTGVAFYRIRTPAVAEEEMAAIVRMQAESLLPLPPEQIEVAWRTSPSTNGDVDITIAAARREYLHKFAGSVRRFRPREILLSCEGMARAWQNLFSDGERQALLVSIGAENTQVCLVRSGQVTHAAVLGTGVADLGERGLHEAQMADPPSEIHNPQSAERFAQDLRAVLTSFGWDESSDWPMLVLSDGGETMERIVQSLNLAGLPAKASLPSVQSLKAPSGFGTQEIYDYRVPLGLALIGLEQPAETLNLFEGIAADEELQKTASAWRSVLLAGAVAFVALVALILTVYFTDVASAKRWNTLVATPEFEAARQHQALLKTVARHRPDMLQLLADISAGENDGIVLDSLHFKKGQTATIAGRAGNMEQMWKYQTGLIDHKNIDNVEITNAARDSKTKKIKFTMVFEYRNFSRKEAAL